VEGAFQNTASTTLKLIQFSAPNVIPDFIPLTLGSVTQRIVYNSTQQTGLVRNAKVQLLTDFLWFKMKACVLLTSVHLTNSTISFADHVN
jgi:hypothetical protein